jgi:hypothetical protein
MVQLLKHATGKLLSLPGRQSREAVSGALGSRVSFRIVKIAPQQPGETQRGPHLHRDFEECRKAYDDEHRPRTACAVVLLAVPDVGSGTVEFASF